MKDSKSANAIHDIELQMTKETMLTTRWVRKETPSKLLALDHESRDVLVAFPLESRNTKKGMSATRCVRNRKIEREEAPTLGRPSATSTVLEE